MPRFFPLALLAAVLFPLSAVFPGSRAWAGSAGSPPPRTVVRMASDPTWPPMEFEGPDGNVVGYSIDFMRAVCREADLELEIRKSAWTDIFDGLRDKRWDVIMSSITITPERRREMLFTIPYYIVRQCLLVPAGSRAVSLREFQGGRVGALEESTAEALVRRVVGDVASVGDIAQAVEALAAGSLDAVVCEDVVAQGFLDRPDFSGKVRIAAGINTPGAEEFYGMALRPGDVELLIRLNDGIKAVKAAGLDREIRRRWFGAGDNAGR